MTRGRYRSCRIVLGVLLTLVFSLVSVAGAATVAGKAVSVARAASRRETLTGYTRARRVLNVVSEEAGRCVRVTADVGDPVPADGVFAVLDSTFIDLSLERNRVARKRLENLIAYLNKDVDRYMELVGHAAAAQATLDALENKKDQAAFDLQSLRVEKRDLEERRARHRIKAPGGWLVIERRVEPGSWVAVGQVVARVGDFTSLLVPFALTPAELRAVLSRRQRIRLHFPDEGKAGVDVDVKLLRVSPAFDPKTRKTRVDLLVSDGLRKMRGGLRAVLTVVLPDGGGSVWVAADCLVERYEDFWLVRDDGRKIRVTYLGKGPDGFVRIRSPRVRPGDRFLKRPRWSP